MKDFINFSIRKSLKEIQNEAQRYFQINKLMVYETMEKKLKFIFEDPFRNKLR